MDTDAILPFVFATLFLVVVPIVWALLHHQRKMAELIHGKREQQQLPQQVDPALNQQLELLRQTLAQQAIAIDSLAESQRALAESLKNDSDVRHRLTS